MHVDDVRTILVAVIPSMLEEIEALENPSGPAHEDFEKREFFRRALDPRLIAPNLPCRGVKS